MKSVTRTFGAIFFGCPYHSNSTKWHLDAALDIAVDADDTTLYSKCDQASDLWQQLELASEPESEL